MATKSTNKRSYAEAFAGIAEHAWKHRTAVVAGARHHILIFDYEKTDKAKQSDLLSTFQLDSLAGCAKLRADRYVWTHPTRVPFALASMDADPFVIADEDISSAYGPVSWFLMLDLETGEVYGVDVTAGYVAEEGATMVVIASSVAGLEITEGSTL